MSLQDTAARHRALLVTDFENFIADAHRWFDRYPLAPAALDRILQTSLLGKQWRGLMVMMMAEWLGWKDAAVPARLATAVELLQTSFLVHDDIIDQDRVRRGQPSMFALYEQEAEMGRYPQPTHYGVSQAICVGDVGLFLLQKALNDLPIPDTRKIKIWHRYIQESLVTGFAEMCDVHQSIPGKKVATEDVIALHRDKTSRYSFCLPFLVAATLTEQTPTTHHLLEKMGEKLGILFQIKDDELGLFGSTEQIGKNAGSDVREGKKTLHYLYFMELAQPQDKKALLRLYGKPDLSMAELDEVRLLIKKSGANEKVTRLLSDYEEQVRALLEKLPIAAAAKAEFHSFIDLNVGRLK